MSSKETARHGAQEPRIRVEPQGVGQTDGPDAADLLAECGPELFPWQRTVLDAWLARGDDDRPMYSTCGLSVPRQNGKNYAIEARELYGLAVAGEHILHTAHRVKTAKKSFMRLVKYFNSDSFPELKSMVEKVRYTNGEEAIYLSNGASVEFVARNRGASRGFDDISLVVFDEAQELTDEQLEAIMFTLAASASGDRQMLFTGTPPGPTSPGTVFARTRESAASGRSKRLCWHEWSVEGMPAKGSSFESLLDDVYATNPSMGYVLDEEFTGDEFASSALDGFARERLGWWSGRAGDAVVTAEEWAACAVLEKEAPPEDEGDKVAFGVKFSPDGSTVALAGCVCPKGGTPHVELVECRPLSDGTDWLAEFLASRRKTAAAMAVDGLNGSAGLVEKLSGKVPKRALVVPSSKDVVAAADMFLQAVKDRRVTHLSEGQETLDSSALGAVRRPVGGNGGWGWGGDSPAPVEAASLAYWAAATTKRKPGRGCRML